MVVPCKFSVLDELGVMSKRTVTSTRWNILNDDVFSSKFINFSSFCSNGVKNSLASVFEDRADRFYATLFPPVWHEKIVNA